MSKILNPATNRYVDRHGRIGRQILRDQTELWSNKCKKLEEKCPTSSTFLGEEWCDVDEKEVVHTSDYRMCFKYSELLRMIHEGFVATDTSYQVPPLRLKLPRDGMRQFIPKSLIRQLLLDNEIFARHFGSTTPHELFYFFAHLDDFYKTFDKPRYKSSSMNPVELSRDIERWFRKYKSPLGGLKLYRYANGEIKWRLQKPAVAKWRLRNGIFSIEKRHNYSTRRIYG